MTEVIRLSKGEQPGYGLAWFADFEGDEDVRRLFGTTKLATPFSASVPVLKVLAAIQAKNPNHYVVAAPEVARG